MKLKTITLTTAVITLAFIIAILGLVIFLRENQHTQDLNKATSDYNYQQERYLENISEQIENYNELYADFNELYKNYNELAGSKGFYEGWEKYLCTGYTSLDEGCNSISASGINILKWSEYFNFCAVPPEYELGTIFLVKFGNCIEPFLAVDRGGAIQIEEDGRVHIDLYFVNDLSNAFYFGVKELEVKVIK